MRHGLVVGTVVVGGVLTATVFAMFLLKSAQLTLADLPAPEAEPTRTPTPRPTIAPVEIWRPAGTQDLAGSAVDTPIPFIPDLIDLNIEPHRYSELGISPEKELALFRLRCELPVPPRTFYEGVLEGCNGGGGGITYLDDAVDAGIMTRQEANDTIAGLVVQQWR